ncbi:relaxase domain-containing protein [Streptomyces bungoensis]|uniref:relaxase domain-containing protein n=1 Tax=Streptomyces bungoensis TaxID=285568 RepID=UPI00344ADE3F
MLSGVRARALTGYDLVFSAEEPSLLFALGGPQVRRIVLEVLVQVGSEILAWVEHHMLVVRTGPAGVAAERRWR